MSFTLSWCTFPRHSHRFFGNDLLGNLISFLSISLESARSLCKLSQRPVLCGFLPWGSRRTQRNDASIHHGCTARTLTSAKLAVFAIFAFMPIMDKHLKDFEWIAFHSFPPTDKTTCGHSNGNRYQNYGRLETKVARKSIYRTASPFLLFLSQQHIPPIYGRENVIAKTLTFPSFGTFRMWPATQWVERLVMFVVRGESDRFVKHESRESQFVHSGPTLRHVVAISTTIITTIQTENTKWHIVDDLLNVTFVVYVSSEIL